MKACVLKDVAEFEVKEVDRPVRKEGEVILKVSACSICGSDLTMSKQEKFKGLIFGHEVCGVIDETGEGSSFKKGDRVIMNTDYHIMKYGTPGIRRNGGYAEYVAVEENQCIPMPDNIPDGSGSLLEPLSIAYGAVKMADIQQGEKVLIIGGGAIASMCALWAKRKDPSIIAMTEISAAKRRKAAEIGLPAEMFKADDPEIAGKLLEKAPDGYDKIIDTVGAGATIDLAIELAKVEGTIVELAIHYGPVPVTYLKLVMKRLILRGFYESAPYFKEVIAILSEEQPFDPEILISEVIGIDDIPEAVNKLREPGNDLYKIVIRP